MTGHWPAALMYTRVAPGDTSVVNNSVQNKPSMPDIEGREDVPDALIPEHSDKEITRIRVQAVGDPGTAVDVPRVLIGRNFQDKPAGSPSAVGNNTITSSGMEVRDDWITWIPEMLGGDAGVDRLVIDPPEPIPWPDMDLVHSYVNWDDANHAGIIVIVELDWQPV